MLAATDVWRWQAHPEVWLLVGGLALLYAYAIRRIGPTAALPGEPIVTRAQVRWFAAALVTLWIASDYPMHDIAENHLYSVHMFQHLLLTFVVAPLALLATPTWLARMVIGDGRTYRVIRTLSRLPPATLLFNAVVVFSHWPTVVEASVSSAVVHYGVHLVVVVSSLLMWIGVVSPLPELRFALPVQAGHLFLQSIVPTVPAGILLFAEKVAYQAYDRVGELWGMTAVEDQQVAAAIMKLGAGTYLWVIIAVIFVRFATRSQADDRERGVALDARAPGHDLTWDEVERALAEAGPAPREP